MQAANNEPSDEWEHPTGEDDEAWVGLCVCVCGSLGSQIPVQDTKKPSDEWVEDPAERVDEAWVP